MVWVNFQKIESVEKIGGCEKVIHIIHTKIADFVDILSTYVKNPDFVQYIDKIQEKVKNLSKWKNEKFSTFPHSKSEKMWKNLSYKQSYSHYPHKISEFMWITFENKRTNVLVRNNENHILSRKIEKCIDFFNVKKG